MAPVRPWDARPVAVLAIDKVAHCIAGMAQDPPRDGLGSVSKAVREALFSAFPPGEEAMFHAVDTGRIESLKFFLRCRDDIPHHGFLAHAIFKGHLEVVKILEEAGTRQSALTTLAAAASGRIDFMLPAAEVEGNDDDEIHMYCVHRVADAAILHGDPSVMDAAHELGYQFRRECIYTAIHGSLEAYKHLVTTIPFERNIDAECEQIAMGGDLEKLKIAAKDTPRNSRICTWIASVGDIDTLKWAIHHHLPVKPAAVTSAAMRGKFEIVKYLMPRVKGEVDKALLAQGAFEHGPIEFVEWVLEMGCPIDNRCVTSAATNDIFELACNNIDIEPKGLFYIIVNQGRIDVIRAAKQRWFPNSSPTCRLAAVCGGPDKIEALGFTSLDSDALGESIRFEKKDSAQWIVERGTPWASEHSQMACLYGSMLRWGIDQGYVKPEHFENVPYKISADNIVSAIGLGIKPRKVDRNSALKMALEKGNVELLNACGEDAKIRKGSKINVHWRTFEHALRMGVETSSSVNNLFEDRVPERISRLIAQHSDEPKHWLRYFSGWDGLYTPRFRRIEMIQANK